MIYVILDIAAYIAFVFYEVHPPVAGIDKSFRARYTFLVTRGSFDKAKYDMITVTLWFNSADSQSN